MRSAAAVAVAEAEASMRVSPVFRISDCTCVPNASSFARSKLFSMLRVFGFTLAAVLALAGWQRVAAASRAQLSR